MLSIEGDVVKRNEATTRRLPVAERQFKKVL